MPFMGSLLEQKISEPAVDALKPVGLKSCNLSKRFSDVFTDERLRNKKSVSEIKPKIHLI